MRKIICIFIALGIQGCSTYPAAVLPEVFTAEPIKTSPDKTKKIYVSGVKSKLENTSIGQQKTGTACVNEIELVWANNIAINEYFKESIITEIFENKFNIATDSFDAKNQRESEILISAKISDVKGNICSSIKGKKGTVVISINWDIYNKSTDKIIKFSTRGKGFVKEFDRSGDPKLYINAARDATKHLLANSKFYELVSK